MATLHVQLDFPVPKGPLGPSNSTICPQTAPKRPPKASKFVHIGRRLFPTVSTNSVNRPYLGLRGSTRNSERT